jgi:N-acetyl-gamma-glutamyl-phosphate reductase
MAKVGVAGASGYLGAELLRLCAAHPSLEVAWASGDTQAGTAVAQLYPNLAAAYPELRFSSLDPEDLSFADDLEALFLALPHGLPHRLMPGLLKRSRRVIDLSADFRLRDAELYQQWYRFEHAAPELLADFACGLPELERPSLLGAERVAVPGCYVTAAVLALAPLVRAGLVEEQGIVVDAASGVSGSGRQAQESTQFAHVDEDFSAYGLFTHRHTPEIEQALGAEVLFTPHLAPMNRGILATCYARPTASRPNPLAVLSEAYRDEPFVVVSDRLPSTKATLGSNGAHLSARHDPRTGWVVALCALDNLGKGGSGQAIQCANLALGLDETTGLSAVGVYP